MTDNQASRGLHFEAFVVGQVVTTGSHQVTEADIMAFAALTGDWNPIHTDPEYAAQHAFGQQVAHGMLGISMASGLTYRLGFLDGTILAFREIANWKFSAPIYLGDTIFARASVRETRPVPRLGGGLVTFDVEVIKQDHTIVQRGSWTVLVKSQGT